MVNSSGSAPCQRTWNALDARMMELMTERLVTNRGKSKRGQRGQQQLSREGGPEQGLLSLMGRCIQKEDPASLVASAALNTPGTEF